MFTLHWKADLDYIWSENSQYLPSSKKGHHFLYLNPKIREYKDIISAIISSQISGDDLPPEELVYGIISEYRIGIPGDRYWKRDITNAVKAVEDAFFETLKSKGKMFDDKHVITNIATKICTRDKCYVEGTNIFIMESDSFNFMMKVPLVKLLNYEDSD